MTNIPGFIPKPYPIVILPGTFVIILQKSGGWFFFVSWKTFSTKKFADFFFFDVEKWNVGDHLKRVFPKFEAERSHPRGINGRSKFCKNSIFLRFRRRKMKCRGSSETHFPKVWGRTEPSLGDKQPIKVRKQTNVLFTFWSSKKGNAGDRLKRILAKFEADRSQVWRVNGRSKFVPPPPPEFSL